MYVVSLAEFDYQPQHEFVLEPEAVLAIAYRALGRGFAFRNRAKIIGEST
jgi:hypothetical protein